MVTTKRYGEEQTIQIRGDGIRTVTIQNLFNNRVNTKEACVAHTANDQYTLVLRDDGEDGWVQGSFVDVQTQWGATVYMGRLESGSIQYIPFSLYSPITPDSEWQFSTTFVPDWKDVSATVTNWNSYFSGNWTESVTGTQYFRRKCVPSPTWLPTTFVFSMPRELSRMSMVLKCSAITCLRVFRRLKRWLRIPSRLLIIMASFALEWIF